MFTKSVHHKNKNKRKSQTKQTRFTFTQDAVGIYIKLYANKLQYIFVANCLQQ